MPPRKRRALVDLQNRDPATGRWLPGKKKPGAGKKKSSAGKKPGAGKKKPSTGKTPGAGKKPSAVRKAGAPPSPTSSNEAEAMEMGRCEAADEMLYMSFWDIWNEVGVSLAKIKQIEEFFAKEKGRKKVDLEMIDALEDKLATEKGRKMEFHEAVLEVSKKAAPHFWAGEVQEEGIWELKQSGS